MIQSYNPTWVENIQNQAMIQDWRTKNKLSNEQAEAALQLVPVGFHRANIFIKVGLFVFASIAIIAGISFLLIFTGGSIIDSKSGMSAFALVCCIVLFILLESFIKNNNLYRSGTDNALLYAALTAFFTFVGILTNADWSAWAYCFVGVVVLLPVLLRYGDPVVAIALYLTWIGGVFLLTTSFSFGKTIVPFVMMLVSLLNYWGVRYWQSRETSTYYADSRGVMEILSLATFYLSGNYGVVREGNAMLNAISPSVQISFAPFFYLFTAVVPIIYMVWGLQKKDRKLLLVGIAAFVFAIFTYRYYFSLLPIEWALTLSGIFLIVLSTLSIRALKTPRYGLTYEADESNRFQDFEAFLINQAVPHSEPTNGVRFGKGDFGGGGADGAY